MAVDGSEPFRKGSFCTLYVSARARKEMRKAQAQHLRRCTRVMERFVDEGPESLTDEMFKFEERFNVGVAGNSIAVYAFKSFNLRVYGCYDVHTKTAFYCTHAAIKKRDGADRDLMEAVAREVWELCNA